MKQSHFASLAILAGCLLARPAHAAWSVAADQPRTGAAPYGLTYHVSATGSDSADGLSWTTAFATPHAALAAAGLGDLVLISNGVFAVTNEMVISKGVTIRGVNGAERTVLRRSGSANYRLLQLAHADARVEGVTLTNGKLATSAKGAGVFINGAGTLADCIVSNNYTDLHSYGTGIRIDNGGLVERCRILENTTVRGDGIGVYCYKGGVLRDCLIAGNRPTYPFYHTFESKYGAVYLSDGGALQNCTVTGNDNWLCGGVYSSNNKGKLLNCVVLGNQSDFGTGPGIPDWYGTTTGWTNVCTSAAAGVSPLVATAANAFRDAVKGDWRLRPASPARDAGTTNSVWTPTGTDLDGQPRLLGATVDCGAFEYAVQPACDILCSRTQALGTVAITLTAFLDGLAVGETVDTCSWTFSGSVAPTSGPSASVTCTFPPGRYTVGLTVQTSLRTLAMARTNLIHVAPTVAYAVPAATPGHLAQTPYDSWARAATNIQDALDSGLDGTLVLVSNGTYAIKQQLKLAHGIQVRSVAGSAATSITGASGSKCRLWYILHPDAVVEGFTLARANNTEFTQDGAGGGALLVYGGTLRDCTITRNTGTYKVAGLGAYLYKGGTLSRCIITNNYVSRGPGTGVYLNGGGLVENCLIAYNYYLQAVDSYSGGGAYLSGSAATIRSCTVIGNTNRYAGGIYETGGGHVENCIVRDNDAWDSATTEAGRNYVIATPANALNLCTPVKVGTGCVTNAPHFVDAPRRDYRLKAGSPGWNQGLVQAWMTGALDLDGKPRIDRRLVDIGAYETPYLSRGTLCILR